MSTIYVDFDDVLCETGRGFMKVLEQEFGKRIEFEAIVSYDLGRSFDLEPDALERFMTLAHRDEVLIDLEPIPGAVEALHDWAQAGYRVEIVTGRPPAASDVSRRWLERYGVPHETLLFVEKYAHTLPAGSAPAPLTLSDLQETYCLAIEDSYATARFLAGSLGVKVALLDRPWNRNGDAPLPSGLTRCRGWDELRRVFTRP